MAYTLQEAIESLREYEDLHEIAWMAAVVRLQSASYDGPRALRAEAKRIGDAFYIYADGVNYGRP